MIKTWKGKFADAVMRGRSGKGVPVDLVAAARRKLALINEAGNIEDLRSPPGNRLEALRGDRAGQYSIRINNQWRVCFVWRDGDAYDVEITDYH